MYAAVEDAPDLKYLKGVIKQRKEFGFGRRRSLRSGPYSTRDGEENDGMVGIIRRIYKIYSDGMVGNSIRWIYIYSTAC